MEKIKICIFGDSIAWGVDDKEKGGWPARLRKYFETNGFNVKITNLGVCGDNTDDLLKRFKTEAAAREPNVIIFAIGTNDSQYVDTKNNPRISLEKFQKNLNELFSQAKGFTPKIIFVGLTKVDEIKTTPIPWNKRKYYTNENIAQYNSAIKAFCEENEILFIDMLDLLDKDDLGDGLHPDSQSHQKMFERVKNFLLENKLVEK
ncbi:MAG: hypothetical protein ISS88_01945 [Candidatus Portnoybacteria bacterium]|nr:hypothetical protein [Candidatus Portnoybacteria bacterium]